MAVAWVRIPRVHVKQTAAQKRKEQSRRNNVVHGWAFREHTKEEKEAISHYLDTGEVTVNFPENYAKLDESSKEWFK